MSNNPRLFVNRNPMCDGTHCVTEKGEVRLFPTGGGGNMIYCIACWAEENRYRYEMGRETGCPENWPQLSWWEAEIYKPY